MALGISSLRGDDVRARSAHFNLFRRTDFSSVGANRSRIFELGHVLAGNLDFPHASAVSRGGGLTENLDFSEVRAATGGSARVLAENSDFCHVSAASRGDGLPKNLDFLHVSGCSPETPGALWAPGASPETLEAHPSDLLRCRRRS